MKIIGDCIQFSVRILLVVLLLIVPVGAIGLGLGPTEIEVNDAMRGSDHLKSLAVFNPEDTDISVALEVEGDIADWITFSGDDSETPVNEFVVPSKGNVLVNVHIQVPENTANGIYESIIYAKIIQGSDDEPSDVGLKFRTPSRVTVKVTDNEILEGTAGNFDVSDTEQNAPLLLEVNFGNKGNVVVVPEVSAEIMKDGNKIGETSESNISVIPGESRVIKLEWDTADQEAGEYGAIISVSLGGKVLEEKSLSFEIFPEGTFSRNGELSELIFEGRPYPGKLLKIVGKFNNTGEVSTKANLVGEVYKDGVLEDTFSTDGIIVSTYMSEDLIYYQKVYTGDYTIKAHVVYDNKKTNEQELSFTVGAGVASGQPVETEAEKAPLLPITALCALVLVMVIGSEIRKQ